VTSGASSDLQSRRKTARRRSVFLVGRFSLRYEFERYPAIKMVAIKEYHAAKAA